MAPVPQLQAVSHLECDGQWNPQCQLLLCRSHPLHLPTGHKEVRLKQHTRVHKFCLDVQFACLSVVILMGLLHVHEDNVPLHVHVTYDRM